MTGRPRARRDRFSTQKQPDEFPWKVEPAERELEDKIIKYAKLRHVRHFKDNDPKRNVAGWLDLTLLGNWLLVRELKTNTGRVSKEQKEWIAAWERVGADVGVWRTRDWDNNTVQDEIDACAKQKRKTGIMPIDVIAKRMFLQVDSRKAAGLLWDAHARNVDRVTWLLRAANLMKTIGHDLPSTDEQITQWYADHDLALSAGPAQVFAALRRDFMPVFEEQETPRAA